MIHTDKTILSLSTALLLCFGALSLAAAPDGKGKPPKGNQPVDATAHLIGADIVSDSSNGGRLLGEFINNGDFDTLEGQLATGETITVIGDAGGALQTLEELGLNVLPAQGIVIQERMVSFDVGSGVSWTIRLDRDKQPPNRVQFKMRWVNGAGFEHHLRIGWVVQAYEDEIYPLPDSDYGEVPAGVTSLESATVTFDSDFFRIDGKVPTGRGKKTALEVFSHYGEVNSDSAPWCNMGISTTFPDDAPCVASTMIQTDLLN